MKKKLLKPIVCLAAMLFSSVIFGQTTRTVVYDETYDFEAAANALENSDENFPTYDSVRIFNVQNPSWINIEKMTLTQLETNSRFAAEARSANGFNLRKAGSGWNGLNSGYADLRYFSILGLKNGDKVTITYNKGSLSCYSRDGSAVINGLSNGTAITSGTTYEITSDGRFDIKTGSDKVNIQKIVISYEKELSLADDYYTTYDFTGKVESGDASEIVSNGTLTVDGQSLKVISYNEETFGNRFAVSAGFKFRNKDATWKGLWNLSGVNYLSILSLAEGDRITFSTKESGNIQFKNTSDVKLPDGTTPSSATIVNNQEYEVTSAGDLNLVTPGSGSVHIYSIKIAEKETLTAPSIALKDGVKNTVTITAGTSDDGSANVTTYYTTDGTTPSATNGTAITATTDVPLNASCTVKAVTISSTGRTISATDYTFTYEDVTFTYDSETYNFTNLGDENGIKPTFSNNSDTEAFTLNGITFGGIFAAGPSGQNGGNNSFKLRTKGDYNGFWPSNYSGRTFTILNLSASDMVSITLKSGSKLLFVNGTKVVKVVGDTETDVEETAEVESGAIYRIKSSETGAVALQFTTGVTSETNKSESYIQSVTIKKAKTTGEDTAAEALTDPSITQGEGNTVTVTAGVSSKGYTVKTFYTTDGSAPNVNSTLVPENGEINYPAGCTIVKVLSVSTITGQTSSAYLNVTYTIPAPTIEAGTSANTVKITQNATGDGVTTWYHIGEYTKAGEELSSSDITEDNGWITVTGTDDIVLSASGTIYTVTVSGSQISAVTNFNFSFTEVVQVPTFKQTGNSVEITPGTTNLTSGTVKLYVSTSDAEPAEVTLTEGKYTIDLSAEGNTGITSITAKTVSATTSTIESERVSYTVLAKPTIAYSAKNTITITGTSDGTIHYTTGEEAPTASSTAYSEALTYTEATTIKAIIAKDGNTSDVATFSLIPITADPTFANASEGETKKVTITPATTTETSCTTFWSTDGNAPSTEEGNENKFTEDAKTIDIPAECTVVKAITVTAAGNISSVASYNVPGTLTAPTITAASAISESGVTNTITITAEEGTTIYYTTDGVDPTTESTLYSEPFTQNTSATIKAIAAKDGATSSVATFGFKAIASAPTMERKGNHVIITAGATDEETNTATTTYQIGEGEETSYSEPIVLTEANTTIKAITSTTSGNKIEVNQTFETVESVSQPSIVINEEGIATITAGTSNLTGATVKTYYVIGDGELTTVYDETNKPQLTDGQSIKAITVSEYDPSDYNVKSETASMTYTAPIPDAESAPTISKGSATNGIVITANEEEATVYYAKGEEEIVKDDSHKYTGEFEQTTSTTIKAIAVKEGKTDSEEATYKHIAITTLPTIDQTAESNEVVITIGATDATLEEGETITTTYQIGDAEAVTITEGKTLTDLTEADDNKVITVTTTVKKGDAETNTASATLTFAYVAPVSDGKIDVTYDFTNLTNNTFTASGTASTDKVNDENMNLLKLGDDTFDNHFAVSRAGTEDAGSAWVAKNWNDQKGLFTSYNDRYFTILGLKNGDKITVTWSTGDAGTLKFFDAPAITGKAAGDAVESGTTYTISTEAESTNVNLVADGSGTSTALYIKTVTIHEAETLSAPNVKLGDDENTVVITAGKTNNANATITTYYTTDGTEPTTSSDSFDGNGATKTIAMTESGIVKAMTVTSTAGIGPITSESLEFTYEVPDTRPRTAGTTYNFVVAEESSTVLPTWGSEVTSGGVGLNILATDDNTFDDRFAVGPTSRNNDSGNCFKFRTEGSYKGLYSQYGDRNLSILNLSEGDQVIFTISNSDATLKFVGGSAVVSGKIYTVKADGNMDLTTTGSVYIESITIKELVRTTAPTVALVEGETNKYTITSGKSNDPSATVSTYYTTASGEATPEAPTAESTPYTEPIEVTAANSPLKIKAISISTSAAGTVESAVKDTTLVYANPELLAAPEISAMTSSIEEGTVKNTVTITPKATGDGMKTYWAMGNSPLGDDHKVRMDGDALADGVNELALEGDATSAEIEITASGNIYVATVNTGEPYKYSDPTTKEVIVIKTAPTISVEDNKVTITAGASDGETNIATTKYSVSEGETPKVTDDDVPATTPVVYSEIENGKSYTISATTSTSAGNAVTVDTTFTYTAPLYKDGYGTFDFVKAPVGGEIVAPTFGSDVTCNGVEMQMLAYGSEETYGDKFAVGPKDRNTGTSAGFIFRTSGDYKGLWSQYADRNFSILSLKKGDKVTITISKAAETLKFSDTSKALEITSATDNTAARLAEGATAKSGTAYYITADCNLDFVTTGGVYIESVKIEEAAEGDTAPTVAETVSKPTITDNGDNTVTITAGVSDAGMAVTTYYTTDGTEPTAESTEYKEALALTEDCTVKAVTISEQGTKSEVAELAFTYVAPVEGEENYNFVVAAEGQTAAPTFGVTAGGTDLQMLAYGTKTFGNRFAVGPTSRNDGTNKGFIFRTSGDYKGLWSQYDGRNFSILSLKQGDKVTITISKAAETLKFSDTSKALEITSATDNTAARLAEGATAKSGTAYYITADCNLDFVTTGGVYIESVKIEAAAEGDTAPTVAETVSKPTITDNGDNTVTITAGVSDAGMAVTTYYTTDGTEPTAESTKYEEALALTEDCTVKAVTISEQGTKSEVAELAFIFKEPEQPNTPVENEDGSVTTTYSFTSFGDVSGVVPDWGEDVQVGDVTLQMLSIGDEDFGNKIACGPKRGDANVFKFRNSGDYQGLYSQYADRYLSILNLKNGDQVTIVMNDKDNALVFSGDPQVEAEQPSSARNRRSDANTEPSSGDKVESGVPYTVKTSQESTSLDFKTTGSVYITQIIITEASGTTSILGIEKQGENEIERIYDLSGRRVQKMVKGRLYIVNGKKVLYK